MEDSGYIADIKTAFLRGNWTDLNVSMMSLEGDLGRIKRKFFGLRGEAYEHREHRYNSQMAWSRTYSCCGSLAVFWRKGKRLTLCLNRITMGVLKEF